MMSYGYALSRRLDTLSPLVLPTLARLVFAAVLLIYFWSSALTKLGAHPFAPDPGAYAQIFPRAFEAAVGETDRFWKRFEARLVAAYGERRGRAMSCRLRGLPPSMCGRGES